MDSSKNKTPLTHSRGSSVCDYCGKTMKRHNYGWSVDLLLLGHDIYRVSRYIGNSKFGIKILFDGRGYGGKIFRTLSNVYWV